MIHQQQTILAELFSSGVSAQAWTFTAVPSSIDVGQTLVQLPKEAEAGKPVRVSIRVRDSWGNLVTNATELDCNGTTLVGPGPVVLGVSQLRSNLLSSSSHLSARACPSVLFAIECKIRHFIIGRAIPPPE